MAPHKRRGCNSISNSFVLAGSFANTRLFHVLCLGKEKKGDEAVAEDVAPAETVHVGPQNFFRERFATVIDLIR